MKNHKPKIFCIGLNKTGTTSLGGFLEQHGFFVERQAIGERLLKSYLERDFKTIIKRCKKSSATVFQDIPYSLPYTFIALDQAFPEAKFILTLRDSPNQWYESMLTFHSLKFNNGKKPDAEALKNSKYIYKGWAWELMNGVYIKDKPETYDKADFIKVYELHRQMVTDYFNNPNKLITINLAAKPDVNRLCQFLEIEPKTTVFPRISSEDIASKNYKLNFLGIKK
ncbi:MAG TPA: sulfotransferase [Flavobacteriaceae bacterium]|nr:sulfotransferase [Flavobacteriaceae bacterium]